MPVLIAARAVQGVGGGGLVVTAISALAQMFTREELVRRQGHLTGVFALSSPAGPPLGGLLAAGPGWRWIFLVNLPLCAAAAALSLRGLPGRAQDRGPGSFDTRGAVLVTVIGGSVVALGSVQSLARNPWGTAVVLAVVAVCALLFVRAERRAAEPLIPPALFRDRAVSRSIASTALTGVALFGTFAFIPLAIQEGTGAGSGETGLLLLALTTGQPTATTTFSVIAQGRARPDLIGSTMGALTFARQLGRRDLPGRRPGRRAPRQGRRGRARGPGRRDHPPPGTGITADRRPVTALDLRVPAQDGTG